MIPTLILQNAVIEVINNHVLQNQPYLIRLNTWGQRIEIRADIIELQELGKFFCHFGNLCGDDNDTQLESELENGP